MHLYKVIGGGGGGASLEQSRTTKMGLFLQKIFNSF